MKWLENIKPEDLPRQYRELAEIIGLENTVKLAKRFGKVGFYFSKIKAGEPLKPYYQEMAELIGLENTLKLEECFLGRLLYLSGLEETIKLKRHEYIAKYFRGNNHKELAHATGYSEIWVRVILNQTKKINAIKQRMLF